MSRIKFGHRWKSMMNPATPHDGEMCGSGNRRVTEADIDEIGDSAQDFLKNFPARRDGEDMIPVYQNHLTKSDVDAWLVFMLLPLVRNWCGRQAAMAGETMELVFGRVQKAIMKRWRALIKKPKKIRATTTARETPEQDKN